LDLVISVFFYQTIWAVTGFSIFRFSDFWNPAYEQTRSK